MDDLDDVLEGTLANDANDNPVFNPVVADTLKISPAGITLDVVRVYNQTFIVAQQCTVIIGGTWGAGGCALP